MLMDRMCTIAADSKPIQYGNPHRSDKVSIRCTAHLSFTKFELAATPPSPAGTACPRSGSKCSNFAAEPAIRADNDGNFYASSENSLLQGADAWKASDGGLHYRTLLSPNQV